MGKIWKNSLKQSGWNVLNYQNIKAEVSVDSRYFNKFQKQNKLYYLGLSMTIICNQQDQRRAYKIYTKHVNTSELLVNKKWTVR